MLKFERILCPVDFSDYSAKAYEYAQSLARHYGAELTLQHVIQPLAAAYPYYAFPDAENEIQWRLEEGAEKELKNLVKSRTWDGVQPNLVIERGPIAETILCFANRRAADMIVMGTHGRTGFDRITMGSVTEKVLRKAHCPALVIRKPEHDFISGAADGDPVRLKKILLCTDFSDDANRAMGHAVSMATEYDAELTLLHVIEEPPFPAERPTASTNFERRLLEALPQDFQATFKVKTAILRGVPYKEIIHLAGEERNDLIVMGVRGRNALDLALFGSTTHRVIRLGPCPVLTVPLLKPGVKGEKMRQEVEAQV
jgi:nucleotide-binding universal stress UspA family protein